MSETFRFCPHCGGPLASRSLKSGDPDRLVCDRCGFVFYLDPKVAVGTIIDDGHGRIVLVKRAIEPGYGKWVFPGGYVDRGELVQRAAVREAREECGLDVRLDGLVDIYSYSGGTPIVIVFAASLMGGDLAVDDTGAIWARQQSGFLLRIDPNRNAVVERVAAPASLSGGSLPITGDSIWTTASDDAALLRLRR